MTVPIHITSVEIYHAAMQRISDLAEASEGTTEEADRLALIDAVARWEIDQGELPAPVV